MRIVCVAQGRGRADVFGVAAAAGRSLAREVLLDSNPALVDDLAQYFETGLQEPVW